MRKLSAAIAVLAAVVLGLAVLAPAASGQTASAVTLEASADRVRLGGSVTLSGTISPPSAGQEVDVIDRADDVVGTATTGASGGFSIQVRPERTTTYRATWDGATSEPVTVHVRAEVTVRTTPVRLFDDVTVRGTADPASPGERVDVFLMRAGRAVGHERVEEGPAGGFSATFRVLRPGSYRGRAEVGGSTAGGVGASDAQATPLPALRSGSRGVFVELLERRLAELHYRLLGVGDGRYDARTADAVLAFHKVQRMPRVFTVGAATWRALARPILPRPRYDWHGFHFEVDQTRQVLYAVQDGEITAILHVSTGKPSTPTRDGVFQVVRKIAGYSGNHLYYPSYFDGNRALHGWPDVPTYAASHGCVRIPYWNALWVYGLADFGVRVAVYH